MQDPVIQVEGVSKYYAFFDRPQDRLKQALTLRLHRFAKPFTRLAAPRYSRTFTALNNVSFDVSRGEALGILGRNGAGKSTLLQIIAGTLAPSSGRVTVRGKVAALLELGSGFSPDFTGRENVRLSASLLGLDDRQIDERFDAIAAFADIGDFIDQPVKTYSSGMMLRVAFAVQTAVEPDILIVDEALAVGDARFQKRCFDRLSQLLSRGTTVLFVTHDTGAIVQFCSRAMILEAGSIFADALPQLIVRQYHRLLFETPEKPPASALQNTDDVPPSACDSSEQDSDTPAGAPTLEASNCADISEGPQAAGQEQNAASAVEVRRVRYGSREAEIVAFGVRDERGADVAFIETLESYELWFRVHFLQDVSNTVGYGLLITTSRGVEVFATNARQYGRSIPPSKKGDIFECTYRTRLPLVPGAYLWSVVVVHDDGRETGDFIDCRFDAMILEVVGRTRSFTTCLVDLGGELCHRRVLPGESGIHAETSSMER